MYLLIAVSWIKVREHTDLDLSVLVNASSLGIQPGVLVTKSVKLLNGKLTLELIKDYHVVIVWIEASPVIVVRTHVSPTRSHDLSNYGRFASVCLTIDPSMFALLSWIKWIVVGPCRDLLNLLLFEDLIVNRKILTNLLQVTTHQQPRMFLNDL